MEVQVLLLCPAGEYSSWQISAVSDDRGFVLVRLFSKCWDGWARARQGRCCHGILASSQLVLHLLGERRKREPVCVINYLALLVCASVTDTLHRQYQPVTLCCRWQGNFLQLQVLLARGSKSLVEKGVHFKAVRYNQNNLAYHTDFLPSIQRLKTNPWKKQIWKPHSWLQALVVVLLFWVWFFYPCFVMKHGKGMHERICLFNLKPTAKKLTQVPCGIWKEERRAVVENSLPRGKYLPLKHFLVLQSISGRCTGQVSPALHSYGLA